VALLLKSSCRSVEDTKWLSLVVANSVGRKSFQHKRKPQKNHKKKTTKKPTVSDSDD
jgi:hypothetical protein